MKQKQTSQQSPENRRKELRYLSRLGKQHLLAWPSKRTYPRYTMLTSKSDD